MASLNLLRARFGTKTPRVFAKPWSEPRHPSQPMRRPRLHTIPRSILGKADIDGDWAAPFSVGALGVIEPLTIRYMQSDIDIEIDDHVRVEDNTAPISEVFKRFRVVKVERTAEMGGDMMANVTAVYTVDGALDSE